MKKIYYIFALHIVLLVLASTNFSIVSCIRDDIYLSWNYYTYSCRTGWGYEYVSEYSLAQVLAYLAAYGVGLVFFVEVFKKVCSILGAIGTVMCAVGLISFAIEGSHWIWSHHLSLIGSFPIVMAVLWVVVGLKVGSAYRAECRHKAGANPIEQETGAG